MLYIMTPEGWKPLYAAPQLPEEPFKNPFRCWETAGVKSFRDWLART